MKRDDAKDAQSFLDSVREEDRQRIAELEAERDRLQKRLGHEFMERGEQHFVELERQNALLLKALEDVEEYDSHPGLSANENMIEVQNIARAALARIPEAKPPHE